MKRSLKKAKSLQEHSSFHWHRRFGDAVEVISRHHSFGGIVGVSGDDTDRPLLKYALPVVERLDSLLHSYVAESFPRQLGIRHAHYSTTLRAGRTTQRRPISPFGEPLQSLEQVGRIKLHASCVPVLMRHSRFLSGQC